MKVLYFAWLKDRVGLAEEEVSPPAEVATVAALVDWLKQRSPRHAEAFADLNVVRCAIDLDHARLDQALDGAREVAFFPPVTGGAG
ncbi:MAG: molybdopterin converting factor subunit 1 [Alphaproteobacteria bacterium]